MTDQAPAGWYPDARGDRRYWDGQAWTEQVWPAAGQEPAKKPGAFSKLGAAVKQAAVDKKTARDALVQQQAEDALAAGALVTSGVFGTSTVEIYANAYVRVASWAEGSSPSGVKAMDKNAPFERLRSVVFTQPEEQSAASTSTLEGTVGPAVAKLMKGGKGLMMTSGPGLAAAGIAHLASNVAKKTYLTIVTDRQIHTLTNQGTSTVGIKLSNKGHNEVGRALEVAANSVLGVVGVEPKPVDGQAPAAGVGTGTDQPAAAPTLSNRLRELAELHRDGILSDEEFASAKATLLGGL